MVSVALGGLKKRLQRYYQKAYPDSGEILPRLIDEEEAKAREISFFPHLILSDLVDERIRKLGVRYPDGVRRPAVHRPFAQSLMKYSISTPSVIHLDEATFDQVLGDSKVPTLVDFWATWCGPCRIIAPILEEIAEEQAETVCIVKVDVDNNPELSNRFGIRNIPALLFFKGGELKDQVVGLTSKADLISRLNALK